MTDNRTQVNNRPFVPGSSGSSTTHDWKAVANATTAPTTNHYSSKEYEDLVKKADSGDEASKKRLEQINAKYNAQYNGIVNETVMSILDGDDYLDNALNASYNPTYHFRLFMTSEHELITEAKNHNHADLLKALDSLPQVTIAESGVTAGFNIQSVEMDQAVGPGWRTRSSMMSGMTINIVEPMGSSFIEDIVVAGANLGVSNYAKFWYFIELSFLGYGDDGSPQVSVLGDMNLSNGGRWVYQIAITNIRVNTDETGSRYELECIPYSQATAFDTDSVGTVCDNLKVSGGTVKDFCDNFAKAMEDAWEERYVGKIYTFKIVNRPVIGPKGEQIDVGALPLNQSEKDPQHHIAFGSAQGGRSPEALIPRGASVSDVLTFLYAHCEGMQKIMLDTESTEALDDGDEDTVSWNGKKYRVAMIPYIEPDVRVVGYDPITGNYMKEITFNIWGYRNYGANISPNQYKVVTEKPQIAADIAAELKKNNYLQKRYYYLFTGKNTEVINFDLSYNFSFSAVLPSIAGHRQSISSVSDHEKYNEEVRKDGGSQASQKNELTISPEKLNQKLNEVNSQSDQAKSDLDAAQQRGEADKAKDAQSRIDQLRNKRAALTKSAELIRSRYATQSKVVRERIEREGLKYTYAEDADATALPFTISYRQGAYESDEASGFGFFDQWHRGSSLTGALLNQTYTPVTDAMISINLNVRGDPYWLGYSNLERRAITQNPNLLPRPDGRPNFTEGDSTFALILRFPKEIGDDGTLVFRNSDVFNGVYRVTSVKHSFKDGQFTQTIEAFKLELITVTQSEASRNNNNG